jgi:hypothetical protein
MTQYKTYGDMIPSSHQPPQAQQKKYGEDFLHPQHQRSHRSEHNQPKEQFTRVPSSIRTGMKKTFIQDIPREMPREAGGGGRNDYIEIRSERRDPQMEGRNSGGGGSGTILHPPNMEDWNIDITCKTIVGHINQCSDCKRQYKRNKHTYISIILGLLLFIVFLITKLIDKY